MMNKQIKPEKEACTFTQLDGTADGPLSSCASRRQSKGTVKSLVSCPMRRRMRYRASSLLSAATAARVRGRREEWNEMRVKCRSITVKKNSTVGDMP